MPVRKEISEKLGKEIDRLHARINDSGVREKIPGKVINTIESVIKELSQIKDSLRELESNGAIKHKRSSSQPKKLHDYHLFMKEMFNRVRENCDMSDVDSSLHFRLTGFIVSQMWKGEMHSPSDAQIRSFAKKKKEEFMDTVGAGFSSSEVSRKGKRAPARKGRKSRDGSESSGSEMNSNSSESKPKRGRPKKAQVRGGFFDYDEF